jgi:hypothetical protein
MGGGIRQALNWRGSIAALPVRIVAEGGWHRCAGGRAAGFRQAWTSVCHTTPPVGAVPGVPLTPFAS